MNKIVLSAIVLMSVFTKATAQDFTYGAKAGLNVANIVDKDKDNYAKAGFHIGAFVEVPLSEKLSVQPELIFSTQGSKSEGSTVLQEAKMKDKLNYINIPVMFKYPVAEGFNLQAGPQLGILTSAKLKKDITPTTTGAGLGLPEESKIEDSKDNYKSIDFALNLGVGYEFGDGLLVDARYSVGLSNIYENKGGGNTKANNSVFQISLGFKF